MPRKPWDFPLYPLFLAAHYPLFLMAGDIGMFDAGAALRPALIGALGALLIMAVAGVVMRDIHRAALWTAMAVVIFFHFNLIEMTFRDLTYPIMGFVPTVYILASMLLFAGSAAFFLKATLNLTRIGNTVAAVMLAFPMMTLILREPGLVNDVAHAGVMNRSEILMVDARRTSEAPSIIHLVLDGYSRQDVLADLYHFDNTPFLDQLRQLGFAVAGGAVSPYNQTMLVMSSVLTADYLGPADQPMSAQALRRSLLQELRQNRVMETLSGLGYQTAAVDVRYDPVRMTQVDRLLLPRRISNFEMAVYEQSLLHRAAQEFGYVEPSLPKDMFSVPYERELASPYFLYLHALAPHPPFDVNQHGDPVMPEGGWRGLADGSHFTDGDPERRRIYRDGYIDKLMFTNEMVLTFLERIVGEGTGPKVIIIHGDHGGGLYFDQDSADRSCITERFSPLLAVYSTDGRLQADLPPDMNLVNIYRLVFNTYFGTELPFLPSQSSFADWIEPERQQVLPPGRLSQACEVPQ